MDIDLFEITEATKEAERLSEVNIFLDSSVDTFLASLGKI